MIKHPPNMRQYARTRVYLDGLAQRASDAKPSWQLRVCAFFRLFTRTEGLVVCLILVCVVGVLLAAHHPGPTKLGLSLIGCQAWCRDDVNTWRGHYQAPRTSFGTTSTGQPVTITTFHTTTYCECNRSQP